MRRILIRDGLFICITNFDQIPITRYSDIVLSTLMQDYLFLPGVNSLTLGTDDHHGRSVRRAGGEDFRNLGQDDRAVGRHSATRLHVRGKRYLRPGGLFESSRGNSRDQFVSPRGETQRTAEKGSEGLAGGFETDAFYRSKTFGLLNSIPPAWILSVGNSTGFVMKANPSF